MSEKSKFELVTPLELLCSQEVDMVVLPAVEGEIGAMANHTPLLTILKRGLVKIYNGNILNQIIIIDGGIAEINNNKIVILSERAEVASRENKKNLENKLFNSKSDKNSLEQNENKSEMTEIDFYEFVLKNIN